MALILPNQLIVRLILPVGAILLCSANMPVHHPRYCLRWIGHYRGSVHDNQSISGGEQLLDVIIDNNNITMSLRGYGTPSIDSFIKEFRCSKNEISFFFSDNFQTKGIASISIKHSIKFSHIIEGRVTNNSGFYPTEPVTIMPL